MKKKNIKYVMASVAVLLVCVTGLMVKAGDKFAEITSVDELEEINCEVNVEYQKEVYVKMEDEDGNLIETDEIQTKDYEFTLQYDLTYLEENNSYEQAVDENGNRILSKDEINILKAANITDLKYSYNIKAYIDIDGNVTIDSIIKYEPEYVLKDESDDSENNDDQEIQEDETVLGENDVVQSDESVDENNVSVEPEVQTDENTEKADVVNEESSSNEEVNVETSSPDEEISESDN